MYTRLLSLFIAAVAVLFSFRCLRVEDSNEVILGADETAYMDELVEVASLNGGRVLEVGFGTGITAWQFVKNGRVLQHIVCEPNLTVFLKALEHADKVAKDMAFSPFFGFWFTRADW
eukprot:gnl/MRDRNA2_/MRDRNA2_49967_c0_seq1.p1 gnl/MRDRNA2_/MRDRNA2_49967_c0~~gnl/MRDRNA2_/MRDRNA2_49967_c0_seq1.p1  ORF type:complete len:117 (+),score=10.07 gnl/MRDRNA2_/MRDRNA2_49967_c0_seq1:162-512(+)